MWWWITADIEQPTCSWCSYEDAAVPTQFSFRVHRATQVEDRPPLLGFPRQFPPNSGTKMYLTFTSIVHWKHCTCRDFAAALAVRYVDDCVVEHSGAGVWQAVLPLPFFMHRMVWAQGASLSLLQAHQFHGPALTANWKRCIFLCAHQTRTWKSTKQVTVSMIPTCLRSKTCWT